MDEFTVVFVEGSILKVRINQFSILSFAMAILPLGNELGRPRPR